MISYLNLKSVQNILHAIQHDVKNERGMDSIQSNILDCKPIFIGIFSMIFVTYPLIKVINRVNIQILFCGLTPKFFFVATLRGINHGSSLFI